ncbi:interferon-induced transmembrane protein [Stackebrandtia albiflava]|uniref:Interferon-induced transmembrane protein n=1 Tax=Stackebrandtia albiflava TaxID=406432 RepID=A0A562V168_9ACTN|nr:CD225/dispanin family protein [Stackebrandtia albiflava]TWJ11618.1 interferon-induced transmembrane protein [Stackebrandtia albiflava]
MAYSQPHAGGTPPSNYLAASIVSIFCCWPFAIPAIIQANKVNQLWQAGDYAGAQEASKQAKKWMTIAFAVGIGWYVLWIVLYAVGAVALFGYGATL